MKKPVSATIEEDLIRWIESEVDGRVHKILTESAKPVEYGQPLFLIDPTASP